MPQSEGCLAASIIQGNTIRGYRYLDDCGKIINRYESDFPQRNWSIEGLTLSNNDSPFRNLNVTPERISTIFDEPDTVRYSIDHGMPVIEEICNIIGVEELSRIAIRIQYVFGFEDKTKDLKAIQEAIFSSKLGSLARQFDAGESTGFTAMLKLKSEGMTIDLRFNEVKLNPENKLPTKIPSEAIMVDTDIYQLGNFSLLDFRRFLRGASIWHARIVSTDINTLLPRR